MLDVRGRRMALSISGWACWRGMSRYFTTWGRRAIVCSRSSSTHPGSSSGSAATADQAPRADLLQQPASGARCPPDGAPSGAPDEPVEGHRKGRRAGRPAADRDRTVVFWETRITSRTPAATRSRISDTIAAGDLLRCAP